DEGHDVAEVAVFHVERRDEDARAHGRYHRQYHEEGQQRDAPVGQEAVDQHQHGQDHEGDQQVHQAYDHAAGGHDQPREVDLGEQIAVGDEAACRFAEGRAEEGPGQGGGAYQQQARHVARHFTVEQPSDEGDDPLREQRPDHAPADADSGLLIAHQDIPPGQEAEQAAIGPQIAPVMASGGAGFKDDAVFVHAFDGVQKYPNKRAV